MNYSPVTNAAKTSHVNARQLQIYSLGYFAQTYVGKLEGRAFIEASIELLCRVTREKIDTAILKPNPVETINALWIVAGRAWGLSKRTVLEKDVHGHDYQSLKQRATGMMLDRIPEISKTDPEFARLASHFATKLSRDDPHNYIEAAQAVARKDPFWDIYRKPGISVGLT